MAVLSGQWTRNTQLRQLVTVKAQQQAKRPWIWLDCSVGNVLTGLSSR
jgi:hypothetical protein